MCRAIFARKFRCLRTENAVTGYKRIANCTSNAVPTFQRMSFVFIKKVLSKIFLHCGDCCCCCWKVVTISTQKYAELLTNDCNQCCFLLGVSFIQIYLLLTYTCTHYTMYNVQCTVTCNAHSNSPIGALFS